MIGTLLIAIIFLALLGALPAWPYSRTWGYAPSGALSTALFIAIFIVLLGRI